MAPQLDAAQHALIETLLKQEFGPQLIASKALCSLCTVEKICLGRLDSEMPTRQTAQAGRRCRMTTCIQKALCDVLNKQPYMYRCEMVDFLFRHFGARIWERSIGRTPRSIG